MNNESKTIRDSIHGDIKLEGVHLDLIEAPEIQRLYNIKQLGFAHLVFPGAHHTRLEHSLGAYYMASQAAEKLKLDRDEKQTIECAALLHDIGHGPFSHTLETILRETLDADHIDLTEKLILGDYAIFESDEKEIIGSPSVCEILEKHGLDQREIISIIRGITHKKPYLSQLLNSSIDVDQLDYLIRDAYYTGVAYGMIDVDRFLQTLTIENNKIAIRKKGIGVVENILMARTLMYSSVYFHKTVRIAELMLSKAIEMVEEKEPFKFFKMTDNELINEMKRMGPYQLEISIRLKYRKLFKQAYVTTQSSLNNEEINSIKRLDNLNYKKKKEQELEKVLDIPSGYVIIDVPYQELHQAEPRIDHTDINIIDEDGVRDIDDFTPVAKAIKSRQIPDWIAMIVTEEKYRNIISNKAEEILFSHIVY
jgi:HD superfamily phosphohydrolase